MIQNAADLIDELGGPSQVGREIGASRGRVSHWKARGFSKEGALKLLPLAEARGLNISLADLLSLPPAIPITKEA
ncbi:MAG: hypothetical protein K2Q12_08165 [Rickettsiales bacterium]|nr:hypothetical protein [Rickettsiales bacterium]